ncbi:MAG: hypothetical protein QOG15_3187 [Solirubrobacteraceae bacterium]|nr:hypothetical protein [Solirubrobacteraceae bacterium]
MRRHAATAALVVLAAIAAIAIVPGMHASGSLAEVGPLDLGQAATPAGAQARGQVIEDVDGYRVAAGGEAVVTVPLTLPDPRDGRTLLRAWIYGPEGVRTTAVLRAADGSERPLGRAVNWVGKTFDVTDYARRGPVVLGVRAQNATAQPVLFLDRLAPIPAARSLAVSASPWSVGLLILLLSAALLELAGRLRRHWPLVLVLAPTAGLLWNEIADKTLQPLAADSAATWDAAVHASWFGFHDGLIWGSWETVSSFTVQAYHAFTPFVGTAPVSARAAAMLTALLALAAIYALAHRAAGRAGAAFAVVLAACAAGFHDAVIAGTPLPALVLAGAVFGYALHACLATATPFAIAMLGASAALLALADPVWLPGALAVVVIVAFLRAERPSRLRVICVGLLAAVVCLAPHLASTASQNDGRMFADADARAVAARNAEFVGDGHGAPTQQQVTRDPFSGRRVGLAGYLFGDHSPGEFIGGALAGGQDSITAFNDTEGPGVPSSILFIVMAAGAVLVLLLPRLRLLVLLTPLVVAPALFIAAKAPVDPAVAGAVLWPVMLACAAIMLYVAARLARPLFAPQLSTLEDVRARIAIPRLRGHEPATPDPPGP